MLAWTRLYYMSGPTLGTRLSFQSNDQPWLPPNYRAEPIMGVHYFGDLQLPLAWAQLSDPWSDKLAIPANFMPTGKFILMLAAHLPIKVVLLFYICTSLGLLFYSAKLVLSLDPNYKMHQQGSLNYLTFLILFILVRPLWFDLDRGNFYTICISLLIIAICKLKTNNNIIAIGSIFTAVSFKWFLIIPLFLLVDSNKLKKLGKMLALFTLINLSLILILPGGLFQNLATILKIQSQYTGTWSVPYLMNGTTLTSSISRIIELIKGPEKVGIFLSSHLGLCKLVALVYLLICIVIALKKSIPIYKRLYFALSTISFVSFEAQGYTFIWISFALAVWLLNKNQEKDKLGNVVIVVTALCLLIPTWVSIPGTSTSRLNEQLIFPPILSFIWGSKLVYEQLKELIHRKTLNDSSQLY